mmetsp:Transcript_47481/g.109924  ORF Transcript_47481/g.109924 Transcript_47481/m.109924 type:complete len:223 (+) Transcript_47481:327-995(+)
MVRPSRASRRRRLPIVATRPPWRGTARQKGADSSLGAETFVRSWTSSGRVWMVAGCTLRARRRQRLQTAATRFTAHPREHQHPEFKQRQCRQRLTRSKWPLLERESWTRPSCPWRTPRQQPQCPRRQGLVRLSQARRAQRQWRTRRRRRRTTTRRMRARSPMPGQMRPQRALRTAREIVKMAPPAARSRSTPTARPGSSASDGGLWRSPLRVSLSRLAATVQ